MCRDLVAKVLNMFKLEFYAIFPQNIREPMAGVLRNCRTTVGSTLMRVSLSCRREIWANLQCDNFATLVQMSQDCPATVLSEHMIKTCP